eukprot:969665-Amphidinium_carterae.1
MQSQLEQLLAPQQELHARSQAAERAAQDAQQRAVTAEAAAWPHLGQKKRFVWCFGFTTYIMGGANPDILAGISWAETQADIIPDTPQGDEHRRDQVHSQQFFLALSLQVSDSSDGITKLMNIPNYVGLEGWRVMKQHYEPLTRGNAWIDFHDQH